VFGSTVLNLRNKVTYSLFEQLEETAETQRTEVRATTNKNK
jgi:hypothetical protein